MQKLNGMKKGLICAGVAAICIAGAFGVRSFAADGNRDHGQIAKVVSVSGSTLTVQLAEMPEKPAGANGESRTAPTDANGQTLAAPEKQGEKPAIPTDANGETLAKPTEGSNGAGAIPTDANGETMARPTGASGEQKEKPSFTYAGDSTSYTIADDVQITRGMEHASASESDLSEGTVVSLTVSDSTVTKIEIMGE